MTMRIQENKRMGETSKFSIDSQGKIVRTYAHKRRVLSPDDGTNWDLAQALAYSPGQAHSSDTKATLRDMELDRNFTTNIAGAYNVWDLTLNYSTETATQENNSEDPTQARVKRTWQTTEQTIHAIRDRNGDLIVNGANQPFDGGVPVTVELPTLVYERNESDFSGATMALYANSLNSDTFSGADPGTLKLKISATEKYESTYHYWAVRYEMAYFPDGWQPKPVNAGLYQLVSGKLVRCKDRDRQDVTSPVPLDTSGVQIPIASLPGAANFITVSYFNTISYASLGLSQV